MDEQISRRLEAPVTAPAFQVPWVMDLPMILGLVVVSEVLAAHAAVSVSMLDCIEPVPIMCYVVDQGSITSTERGAAGIFVLLPGSAVAEAPLTKLAFIRHCAKVHCL